MQSIADLPATPAFAVASGTQQTVAAKVVPPKPALPTAIGGIGGFSNKELEIIKNSSFINNKIFQPWLPGEEEREKFRYVTPVTWNERNSW